MGFRILVRILPALAFIALAGLAPRNAQSQDTPWPETVSLGQLGYTARSWSREDGIPTSYISSIAQTADGFLWWENDWGAVRFDGAQARPFLAPESSLGEQQIRHVFSDSRGRLWFTGYRSAGYLEGAQFRSHMSLPGEARGWGGIIEDSDGGVWAHVVEGRSSILVRLNPDDPPETIDCGEITKPATFGFADGALWAAGPRGVDAIAPTPTVESSPRENQLSGRGVTGQFFRRRDGSLAVATARAIFARRNGAWEEVHTFLSPISGSIAASPAVEDQEGNYWIGSAYDGLWLSMTNGFTTNVSLPEAIDGKFGVEALLCDSENNIWFAAKNRIFQIHKVSFEKALMAIPSDRPKVVDVAFDPSGSIWALTTGSSQNLWYFPAEFSQPQLVKGVRAATQVEADATGQVWAAGQSNIWKLSEGNVIQQVSVPNKRLHSLCVVDGTVWLGTSEGLSMHRDGEAANASVPSPPSSETRSLATAGDDGSFWIYQEGQGCFRLEGESWHNHPYPDWARAHRPTGIYGDPEGRLWSYGIGGGLLCYDRGTWTSVVHLKAGIPVEVLDVVSSREGGLWILTRSSGIARLDRNGQEGDKRRIDWFGEVDGIPSSLGQGWGKGANISPDGRLWFATSQGVAVIDPTYWSALRENSPPPLVHLDKIIVDDLPVARQQAGDLEVPNSRSRFEIHYTALGLKNAADNRFRYRLENWDEDWIDAGTRRVARYQKLPPGNYRFQLAAANSDGKWNLNGAELKVAVLPAWWQRRTVQAGFGFAGVAALGLILQRRRMADRRERLLQEQFARQLIEAQESERKRIASDLHDSLGQDLLLAKNQLYLFKQEHDDPSSADKIDRTIESVNSALKEARAISHQLRPMHLERLGLTKALRWLAHQVAESTHTEIKTVIGNLDGLLTVESELMLFRMVQEALSNVIKHADASTIQLTGARKDQSWFRVEVLDDGRGFHVGAKRKERKGLGLQSFKERAKYLGGRFELKSTPGEGTSWSIEIPVQVRE